MPAAKNHAHKDDRDVPEVPTGLSDTCRHQIIDNGIDGAEWPIIDDAHQ